MRGSIVLGIALALAPAIASADPPKDESGKGNWRGGYERHGYGAWSGERKVKVRTAAGCEVERKWKKGGYEEKLKCEPARYGRY